MALELLSSMASEQEVIDKINEIIRALNAKGSTPSTVEGQVRKGKYAGKQTDWVVENDPWYIQWMCREGHNTDAFGFTELQVQEALADSRPDPRRR